jgi:hypothetical protein
MVDVVSVDVIDFTYPGRDLVFEQLTTIPGNAKTEAYRLHGK